MISALAAGLPLAGNDFGDTQTDGVAGPVGLLIIVVLVIATVFLIRNMSGRIRRLPQSFSDPSDGPGATGDQAQRTEETGDQSGKD
jgi:hypothetical protein